MPVLTLVFVDDTVLTLVCVDDTDASADVGVCLFRSSMKTKSK